MSVFFDPQHFHHSPHNNISNNSNSNSSANNNNNNNKVCRTKPDLRLAESYIPALILCLKCMGYSAIAPIILLMQWKITILSITFFGFLLYVDHIYFVIPNMLFIDTTAISLDILGSTLLVMVMSLLRPCTQYQCQGILALWTFCSALFGMVPFQVPKPWLHLLTLLFLLTFIYFDLGQPLFIHHYQSNNNNNINIHNISILIATAPLPMNYSSLSFYARTSFYTFLVLIDIYLFRPLFQQENERMLFCKYGPVLLASWPWCFVFWIFFVCMQCLQFFQPNFMHLQPKTSLGGASQHPTSSLPINSSNLISSTTTSMMSCAAQDLDVLEAFRLAKQQHMGSKGAN